MFEAKYYCKDYLKKEDRDKLHEIKSMSAQIVSEQSVKNFVEENIHSAGTEKETVNELIHSYNEYLNDRIDVYTYDFIITKIDEYDEEELESVKREVDARKRIKLIKAITEEQA